MIFKMQVQICAQVPKTKEITEEDPLRHLEIDENAPLRMDTGISGYGQTAVFARVRQTEATRLARE
jgi:hypothetical protein